MKKLVLITLLSVTGLLADALTDMATKEIISSKKEQVRKVIVKSTGNEVVGNKIADKVVGKKKKKNPVEKLKSDLVGKALGF